MQRLVIYQNIWCEKRGGNQVEVHLWDDVAGYQNFIFKNYAYVKDGGGQYQSIYGDKLKKVTYWTEEDFRTSRVFESDIPLDTRILLDRYEDSDEPSKNHRELFFDIEVEVTDGFPEPAKADNKVTSIALYTKHDEKYVVYVLGEGKNNIKDDVDIQFFKSESELLKGSGLVNVLPDLKGPKIKSYIVCMDFGLDSPVTKSFIDFLNKNSQGI